MKRHGQASAPRPGAQGAATTTPAASAAAYTPPPPHEARRDAPATGKGGRARRTRVTPLSHDGWTFVLIPPGTNATPRTLRVSRRRLRLALASVLTLAGGTAVAGALLVLLMSLSTPDQVEAEGVRIGVFAGELEDSSLASPFMDALDPAAFPMPGIPIAASLPPGHGPSVVAAVSRSRKLSRTVARGATAEERASANREALAALPVIGRITSGLSRARFHPVLGKVRRHKGVDIAAPTGTHIVAPAAGRVRFSGRRLGYGRVVEIDHGSGVITKYAHCNTLEVNEGDQVQPGQIIATVGSSGLSTGPHLHYEIIVRGRNVDPLHTPLEALLPPAQLRPSVPAAAEPAPAQEEEKEPTASAGAPASSSANAEPPATPTP